MKNSLIKKLIDLRERGENRVAIEIAREELNKYPEDEALIAILSHFYMLEGDLEMAADLLNEIKLSNKTSENIIYNRVRLLLKQNNAPEATLLIKKFEKIFQDSPEGLVLYATCCRMEQRLSEASLLISRVLSVDSENAEALINRGLLLLMKNDRTNAVLDFEKAFYLKPFLKQTWGLFIQIKIEQKKHEDLIPALLKMLSLEPTNSNLEKKILVCLAAANNYQLVTSAITEISGVHSEAYSFLTDLGARLKDRAKILEAIYCYNEVIKIEPNSPEVYISLGNLKRSLGEPKKAIKFYKEAIHWQPDIPEAYSNLGVCLKEIGDLIGAETELKKALELRPSYSECYNNLGSLMVKKGDYSEAIKQLRDAIALTPNFAAAYFNLGIALQANGDYLDALTAFEKSIEQKIQSPANALFEIGNINLKMGRLEASCANFLKAISEEPNSARNHIGLGNAYQRLGKEEAAKKSLNSALKLEPNNLAALVNLGCQLRSENNVHQANLLFQKALKVDPLNVEALVNIGLCYKFDNESVKAIKYLHKAIEVKPDTPELYVNVASAYFDLGHLDEAEDNYKKAIELDPENLSAWRQLVFPLVAKSNPLEQVYSDLSSTEKNNCKLFFKFERAILNYRLSRLESKSDIFLQLAIDEAKVISNREMVNPKKHINLINDHGAKNQNICALLHFGRSGTGLLHTLIDDHPEISTTPSIILSEFFSPRNWDYLTGEGWSSIADQFIEKYEVLFDGNCRKPVESLGNAPLLDFARKEGLASLGINKNEVLSVNKKLFKEELNNKLERCKSLNHLELFNLIHSAYDRALKRSNSQKLIFYHIHNPSEQALINLLSYKDNIKFLVMVRNPLQCLESWIKDDIETDDYASISIKLSKMLLALNDPLYEKNNAYGLKLEDLKSYPSQTLRQLCDWMSVAMDDSLFEMSVQGKQWWGDISSPDYSSDGMNPFGKKSINRKIGSILSTRDQMALEILFFPFSKAFGYTTKTHEQFLSDLNEIEPYIDLLFDFEKKLAQKLKISSEIFRDSGYFKFLRSVLTSRLNLLREYETYPGLLKPLKII